MFLFVVMDTPVVKWIYRGPKAKSREGRQGSDQKESRGIRKGTFKGSSFCHSPPTSHECQEKDNKRTVTLRTLCIHCSLFSHGSLKYGTLFRHESLQYGIFRSCCREIEK